MLGINGGEFVVLLVVALVVVGPERLPRYAEQLGMWVRTARRYALTAKERVTEELGEDVGDVDWAALDPRRYDPRRIVREALLDDTPPPVASKVQRAATGATAAGATAAGATAAGATAAGATAAGAATARATGTPDRSAVGGTPASGVHAASGPSLRKDLGEGRSVDPSTGIVSESASAAAPSPTVPSMAEAATVPFDDEAT